MYLESYFIFTVAISNIEICLILITINYIFLNFIQGMIYILNLNHILEELLI